MIALLGRVILIIDIFPFIILRISWHSLLACRVSVERSASSLMGLPICWGPLMDQNLVVWSQWLESKRQKEAAIPWFTQKGNKASSTGLALFTEASGALSIEWRRRAPSREGLRSLGRKVNSESLCTPGDQPEKERGREGERERERERERKELQKQRKKKTKWW